MNATATVQSVHLARGILGEVVPASATRPGYIVFTLPGSQYAMHLRPEGAITVEPGKRLIGTIQCTARRVDVVRTGGRFVEPVLGRPRRVQGAVLATNASANTVTVSAGGAAAVDGPSLPIVLKLSDPRQKAADFAVGTLVGCDVLDGATFTPAV